MFLKWFLWRLTTINEYQSLKTHIFLKQFAYILTTNREMKDISTVVVVKTKYF